MVGGGGFGWEPGEWTDDTAMAIAIAEVAATGADLRDESAQDAIVARWHGWAQSAKDVGVQTRSVLGAAGAAGHLGRAGARRIGKSCIARTGRTAGNGSLMRTAPVALAYLDDEDALAAAARAVSELTHYDPEAGDACVLWCCAIRHAVRTGALDIRVGLSHIDVRPPRHCGQRAWTRPSRRARRISRTTVGWSPRCRPPGPRSPPPRSRSRTPRPACCGPTICASRWTPRCARATTPTPSRRSPGGLLGADLRRLRRPARWRRLLHGWPGITRAGLVALADAIGRWWQAGHFDYTPGWSGTDTLVRHPHDDGVWIGGVGALRSLPDGVDAVVSLCRVPDERPAPRRRAGGRPPHRQRCPGRQPQPRLRVARHGPAHRAASPRGAHRVACTACRRTPHTGGRGTLRRPQTRDQRGAGVPRRVRGPSGRPPQPGVSRWAETPAPVGAVADLAFWICGISASFRGELLVADLPARRRDRRRAEGRRRRE